MADEDKERDPARPDDAATVDRLLRQLKRANPLRARPTARAAAAPRFDRPRVDAAPLPPDAAPLPSKAPTPAGAAAAPRFDRPRVDAAPLLPKAPTPAGTGRAGIWARVGLGVLLGVALMQWPYGRACGGLLLLYLIAAVTLIAAGVWAALGSWRGRLGLAHVVSLALILLGLALTAHEVLPRVGYARTPAPWRCAAAPLGGSSVT